MPRQFRLSLHAAALLASVSLVSAPLAAQQAGQAQSGQAQAGVRSISQADRAAGSKANPDLIAEFGGAVTGSQAAYVEGVGKTIALQSGLGNARDRKSVV